MKYTIDICGGNPRNNLRLSRETKKEAVVLAKNYVGDVDVTITHDTKIIAFKRGDGKNLHWM